MSHGLSVPDLRLTPEPEMLKPSIIIIKVSMHMPQLGELRRVSLTLPMVKANPKVRRVPIDRSHAAAFQKLLSSFDEGDNVRRCIVTTPLNSMLQSIVSAVVTDIDNTKIARRGRGTPSL
ncbi:hypothetical protein H257_19002 [Aphanomyces astaci]|uniref:Uncharacterized protein n=1 Tax=Aphanomyces astaci TaxID=112090 RepID=W4FBJ5_APHAT|nr:hypothetical protein H257_19002 [Aphanomyces astaci]ETV64053.1 hypothetical protein H257_19002 [Aphanomyces astaci]|eukprot:XP_009846461.1 hypothetical protein H257_19002 [Aphanomyces astaci]